MTKEQIEIAADNWIEKYSFRVPYDGSNNFYDEKAAEHGKHGFIAGALSPEAKAYHEAQGWVSVGESPEQYASIEVKDLNGRVFTGGYYAENHKVCVNLPNGEVSCMDLEENFTHWRPLPSPPKPNNP
jgi:hypothetical protein